MSLIDKQLGLSFMMNMEDLYQSVIKVYVEDADRLRQDIERAFAEENWELYRTHVHALKSASLNIGAKILSEKAKAAEYACARLAGGQTEGYAADNDLADPAEREIRFIKDHHAELLALFQETLAEAKG